MARTKQAARERRRQQSLPYRHPRRPRPPRPAGPVHNAHPDPGPSQPPPVLSGTGVLRVFCIPRAQEFLGKILNTSFVDDYITYNTHTKNEPLLFGTTSIKASALIGGRLFEAEGSTKRMARINIAEIIIHEMIRRQDPLLKTLDPFTSVNFEEEPVEKAASSSGHQSNTRFQFTAYYLKARRGVYCLRGGLKITTTSEDIIPIRSFKKKFTARLSVDGVDYDGIALTKAHARKEAVSNALASLMENEANPTIAPGNPSTTNSRLPPQMNEREMEMVRLEVMDPTSSSWRSDLKTLKKLLFHLKTGQQTIRIVKFVEGTDHTPKEYIAKVTIDGEAYVGVASTADEARIIAAINTLAVIGLVYSYAELSASVDEESSSSDEGSSSIEEDAGELDSSDEDEEHY